MADTWQDRLAAVGAQPKMDVNRARALIMVMKATKAKVQNLDRTKDPKAFDVAILMLSNITQEMAKIPDKVLIAAQEGIDREEHYASASPTFKVGPDPADIDFERLHAVFEQYRQAKTSEKILEYLSTFHSLALTWVNNYKSSRNVERVDAVRQLTGWAEQQIKEGYSAQAGQIYLNSILGSGEAPLQAITATSVRGVKDNVVGKGKQGDLNEAQRAAFRIFSGPDYGYINPAVDRNEQWLQANKARGDTGKAFEDPRDPTRGEDALDTIRMTDEGPLHAGFLNDALKSLPVYDGTVYRGWAIDEKELEAIKKSKQYEFRTPTSTSKKQSVARQFNNSRPEKPIAVICTIEKSGGRDTKEHSAYQAEDEVTIPGGTRFEVTDIKLLDGETPHKGARYEMKFRGPG